MVVYICTKFDENILNGIRVVERTHPTRRIGKCNIKKGQKFVSKCFFQVPVRLNWLCHRACQMPNGSGGRRKLWHFLTSLFGRHKGKYSLVTAADRDPDTGEI